MGWRTLAVGAAFASLVWGQPGAIERRIESAPLTVPQRQAVLDGLRARDFSRVEKALALPPGTPERNGELLALLGALEFLGARISQSIAAFGRADSLRALDERDRFTFAMAYASAGDEKNARAQLERLLAQHPDHPLYLYWLARIDYYDRRYDRAVAKLKRVVELDPGSARAWDNLGLSYDMMGQNDEARQAFEKAVELNRKLPSPSAWPPMNYGSLLLRMQKLPEAESSLRESLKLDPRFAQAHYYLGKVLERSGNDVEAIREFQAAALLAPSMADPEYALGQLYRRLGKSEEANVAFAEFKKRREAESAAPPAVFSPNQR